MYRVRFVNPQEHYRRLKSEIDHAVTDTLQRGDLVLRQQLKDFEQHFAEFVGVGHTVGLSSGYHALHFALLACGIGPGDEVITAGHTFLATVSAIVHTGATPVLADVCDDYNIDANDVERKITSRTKVLLPVHLNGRMCDMTSLMALADRHGLRVVEDAAQALGATYQGTGAGAFGVAGCFSFYPFKTLGGLGDGGALTTNDEGVARMCRRLRYNGEDRETGEYHYHGYTALLDNVQAAVLDVKLRHLPAWLAHRRSVAGWYRAGLAGIGDLRLPHFDETCQRDTYQNYVIRTARRDELRAFLREHGVETLVHWPRPMWCHDALRLPNPHLQGVERLCREVLSLPMSAETTNDDVETTVEVIREFFRG
ncbi:MAG TPA: DegT/DnrJ/EryC1/StrS family aminotransferase [Vicinamibacterales bacterium]|nr:DegT/DnrJ/EryC1/StrS family aminotransferase [Vicinamibacterales bacterium]